MTNPKRVHSVCVCSLRTQQRAMLVDAVALSVGLVGLVLCPAVPVGCGVGLVGSVGGVVVDVG
jgi:hypothetical protein